jgi:hypothetical protein
MELDNMDPILIKDLYAVLFTLSLSVLFGSELYFSRKKKVVMLNNIQHLSYYTLPLVIALVFMILGSKDPGALAPTDFLMVGVISVFYIYLMTMKKLILRNADFKDVLKKVRAFLAKEKLANKLNDLTENIKTIEVPGLEGTVELKSNGRWVEVFGRKLNDKTFMDRMNAKLREDYDNIVYNPPKGDRLYYYLMGATFLFLAYNIYINHRV